MLVSYLSEWYIKEKARRTAFPNSSLTPSKKEYSSLSSPE